DPPGRPERGVLKRLLVLAAACNSAAGPCGDAVDSNFGRTHAQRQTEARQHPERATELSATQLADDLLQRPPRAMYVGHCADDRACVGQGGDLHTCLSYKALIAVENDRLTWTSDDIVRAYTSLADRMCACPDRVCAQQLITVFTKFGEAMTKGGSIEPAADL